ncbi:MAG TPA: thymidine phosphorylase [Chthoniobacterales bacterium]|nr:thymidine phosphorylase [Chthoniobacterales bacterium]
MHVPSLIEKKREGQELTAEELSDLISGFTTGEVPEHQMAAWAMAVFFNGMAPAETRHLATAMMESGSVLEYPADSPPKVGKYSTGGVGDKASLILAPLLACDENWVPMILGRGPGNAGETLDKLESIPGFNSRLDDRRARAQLQSIGVFVIEQSADLCPAETKLAALRDTTGTMPSEPLIVAGILSKKITENLDRLVLDLKFGSGTYVKTRKAAQALAAAMTKVGKLMGVQVRHVLSPMKEPLGRTVGNALEIAECVEVLRGGGPKDVVKLVLDLAEQVSKAKRARLETWLKDGTAWKKFISLVYAQDGDASSLEKLGEIHCAPIIHPFAAKSSGKVKKMDAESIRRALLLLGGGRARNEDAIDFAVGFSGIKKIGEQVEKGEPLFNVHARTEVALRAALPALEQAAEV